MATHTNSQTTGHGDETNPVLLITGDISHRLRLSEAAVRRLIKRGDLVASLIGGRYRISEESLAEFIRERQVLTPKSDWTLFELPRSS